MNKISKIAAGFIVSSMVITGTLAFKSYEPIKKAPNNQKVAQQAQVNGELSYFFLKKSTIQTTNSKPFYSTKFALQVKIIEQVKAPNTYDNKSEKVVSERAKNNLVASSRSAQRAPVAQPVKNYPPVSPVPTPPGPVTQPAVSRGSNGLNGFSKNDLDMLARLINAEAAAEPYEGQVAVAAVVLNRLKSPLFAKTISGIIYEPWAFECVDNGWFYHAPTAQSYKAAKDAINGWDTSNGALYYWNPATATSPWVWQKHIIKTIGNHVFAV